MNIRKLPTALVAATLMVSPLAAQAAPVERTAAPVASEQNDLLGGSILWIVLAIGAVVGLVLLLDDNNDPVSA